MGGAHGSGGFEDRGSGGGGSYGKDFRLEKEEQKRKEEIIKEKIKNRKNERTKELPK